MSQILEDLKDSSLLTLLLLTALGALCSQCCSGLAQTRNCQARQRTLSPAQSCSHAAHCNRAVNYGSPMIKFRNACNTICRLCSLKDIAHGAGSSIAWIVLIQVWRTVALLTSFLPFKRRRDVQPSVSEASVSTAPPAGSKQTTKPGKSIKQLLKEQKQAAGAAHTHEVLPESDLYLNSLKGHGDIIRSVDVSPDNTHVLTACEDEVCAQTQCKAADTSGAHVSHCAQRIMELCTLPLIARTACAHNWDAARHQMQRTRAGSADLQHARRLGRRIAVAVAHACLRPAPHRSLLGLQLRGWRVH